MATTDRDFALDPRLAADTVVVTDLRLCRVCLMNDARFAWLVLVPRRPGVTEIDELADADQAMLWSETTQAMRVLRAVARPDKLNVGAFGNIVRQLHMHVVARREGDAAWPGPVWGSGTATPYSEPALAELCARLKAAFSPRH
ncbi:MAG TPA: HIT family protein [Rhodanobacteraceae bacterium]|nr:HIT family protein [Rhodanobacteraceae bacterium]